MNYYLNSSLYYSYLMNNYHFIPTLSKYFWLARSKNNTLLKLIINDNNTNLLIQNKIIKYYQQTNKFEGNTFINSSLYLNGKINNKDITIKESVKYEQYDESNNLYLRYLLDSNIDKKYNKIMIDNEYDNNFNIDNLWHYFSNDTIKTLNKINALIKKNKENIETLS